MHLWNMHGPLLFLGATDNNVRSFRRLGVLSEHKTMETATHGKLLLLMMMVMMLLLMLLQLKKQQQ